MHSRSAGLLIVLDVTTVDLRRGIAWLHAASCLKQRHIFRHVCVDNSAIERGIDGASDSKRIKNGNILEDKEIK